MTEHESPVLAPAVTIASEEFEALAPEWAALHARCDAPPFLHPAWHEIWLRHFRPGFGREAVPPIYLAARAGDELVGAAALDLSGDVPRLLGDHNVTDYAGVLALPGHEEPVAGAVLEWLTEDLSPRIDLWGTPAWSPMRAAFRAAAASDGWSFAEEEETVAPRALLPADFEGFVAGLGKHDRHELRRKMRNLGSSGRVEYRSFGDPESVAERFDRFLELMRISRDDKDEFLTPAMESYFHDLAATLSGLGLARLGVLALDGADTAMILFFESASTAYLYNSGYDPAFAHLAVGLISKAEAIRDCIERGRTVFDFLRGDEEYKRRIGGKPEPVLTLRLSR